MLGFAPLNPTYSPFGRVLKAIREDEVFAQAMGKNVASYKVLVFVIGAGMASMAGVMYAYYISFIDPTSFTVMESIFIISVVIIGGAGNIWGSVLAAVILVILPEALWFVGMPSAIAANMRQIIYGGFLVIFMLFRPQGFIGECSFCICLLDQADRILFKRSCTSYAHVLLCFSKEFWPGGPRFSRLE